MGEDEGAGIQAVLQRYDPSSSGRTKKCIKTAALGWFIRARGKERDGTVRKEL